MNKKDIKLRTNDIDSASLRDIEIHTSSLKKSGIIDDMIVPAGKIYSKFKMSRKVKKMVYGTRKSRKKNRDKMIKSYFNTIYKREV